MPQTFIRGILSGLEADDSPQAKKHAATHAAALLMFLLFPGRSDATPEQSARLMPANNAEKSS
jgi:hypothetical protein